MDSTSKHVGTHNWPLSPLLMSVLGMLDLYALRGAQRGDPPGEGPSQVALSHNPLFPRLWVQAPSWPGLPLNSVPPPPQVLSTRILAMKASLCKLSPCTVARVCDYHTKLFLMAITSTLKSLLRPHFLNTPDKSPGDRLAEICAKITDVGGCAPSRM